MFFPATYTRLLFASFVVCSYSFSIDSTNIYTQPNIPTTLEDLRLFPSTSVDNVQTNIPPFTTNKRTKLGKKEYLEIANCEIANCIKKLCPTITSVKKIQFFKESYENVLWKASTNKGTVLLRKRKISVKPHRYTEIMLISQKCHQLGIGPKIFGYGEDPQEVVLECIKKGKNNSDKKVMHLLRKMHQIVLPNITTKDFLPFRLINKERKNLNKEKLPDQFSKLTETLNNIYAELLPWLQTHAQLCHGDLHKRNVLFKKHTSRPFFIDFDFAQQGHPFFDIAWYKYTCGRKSHFHLLELYLRREPSPEEKRHFQLMEICILIRLCVNAFHNAQGIEETPDSHMSKHEMEHLLNSKKPIPKPNHIGPNNTTAKDWQLHALRSLRNLLKITETNR